MYKSVIFVVSNAFLLWLRARWPSTSIYVFYSSSTSVPCWFVISLTNTSSVACPCYFSFIPSGSVGFSRLGFVLPLGFYNL
jgi:hypothetical protein